MHRRFLLSVGLLIFAVLAVYEADTCQTERLSVGTCTRRVSGVNSRRQECKQSKYYFQKKKKLSILSGPYKRQIVCSNMSFTKTFLGFGIYKNLQSLDDGSMLA